jgi:hypothetical protein
MIPTMIVLGLAFGRWWKSTLVAAAVVWPAMLLQAGVIEFGSQVIGAALLGAANAAVGAGVHQGIAWVVRRLRPPRSTATRAPV